MGTTQKEKFTAAYSSPRIKSSSVFTKILKMFACVGRILTRNSALPRHLIQQRATNIHGPPKVRISFTEKAILGSVMIIAMNVPSFYIITTVQEYNQKREE